MPPLTPGQGGLNGHLSATVHVDNGRKHRTFELCSASENRCFGSLHQMTVLRKFTMPAAAGTAAAIAILTLFVPAAAAEKAPGNDPAAKAAAPAKPAGTAKTAARTSSKGGEQTIIALVNDEPVTGFEVRQRVEMLSGSNVAAKAQERFKALIKAPSTSERLKAILQEVIKANPGKSKEQLLAIFEQRKKQFAMDLQKQAVDGARSNVMPEVRKAAIEELIDEKLKMQEAKRLGALVPDDEIDKVIKGIAERNKMTEAQLAQQLGGSLDPMKYRIRSSLSWNEVIRRKFGHQISIGAKDVDKFVATAATGGEDQVELVVQRILIAMPAKLDQAGVAQRVSQAEAIRGKFKDCKSTGQIASGVAGAKFDELGKRKPSAFPEPTRSMLLNAKDGEMLPPAVGENGIELFAVCGRDVIKVEEQKRTQAGRSNSFCLSSHSGRRRAQTERVRSSRQAPFERPAPRRLD